MTFFCKILTMFHLSFHPHKCLQSFKVAKRVIRNYVNFTHCKLQNSHTVLQNNCMPFSSCAKSHSKNCHFSFLNKTPLFNGNVCVCRGSFLTCSLQKRFSSSVSSNDDKPPNKTDAELDEQELKDSSSNSSNVTSDSERDDRLKEEKYIEIEDVEDFGIIDQSSVEPAWKPPISLERGLSGVFDLDELCTVLEDENAKDICVIAIPPEAQFADHMVIVSAMSRRHMRAILARVQWIYKRKKSERDVSMRVEGLESDSWFATDLGNIILHIFMPETRDLYDLETLWTVGPEYDENCREMENPFILSEADLLLMEFKEKSTDQEKKT